MNQKKTLSKRIENYFDRLWPIPRSITGDGYKRSLDILSELVPFEQLKFETGKQVLDWTIPKEWVIRDAYIITPDGQKIADFKENNLHIIGYSTPFEGEIDKAKLEEHLYSLPEQSDAIPYVTSYYAKQWGFSISHDVRNSLPEGKYKIVIDSEFINGEVIVGETLLPGESEYEILFSSYLCHPSMANNELSGPLVLSFLYEQISQMKNRHFTYRFVILPETIGTISLLSIRGNHLKNKLIAGYHITCIGEAAPFTYKKSREGNTYADIVALKVLEKHPDSRIIPFTPATGSDERQYCSPGFNLPIGSLMRSMYTTFPEYHTSLDNKDFLNFEKMVEAVNTYAEIARELDSYQIYENLEPYGEPQLGKRGLYRNLSVKNTNKGEAAMWWLLNMCDRKNDIKMISKMSELPESLLIKVAERLKNSGILRKI